MPGRLKLLLTAIVLVAIAAVAIIALSPGSPSTVAMLNPSETDLMSCAPHFAIGSASREGQRGDGDLLVPVNPVRALICRYLGYPESVPTGGNTEGKIESLAAEVHLPSSRAAALADAFDGLEAITPGEYTCPEDNGSAAYVLFAYPAAPTVRVLIGLSGCEFVGSNATANGFHLDDAAAKAVAWRTRNR